MELNILELITNLGGSEFDKLKSKSMNKIKIIHTQKQRHKFYRLEVFCTFS